MTDERHADLEQAILWGKFQDSTTCAGRYSRMLAERVTDLEAEQAGEARSSPTCPHCGYEDIATGRGWTAMLKVSPINCPGCAKNYTVRKDVTFVTVRNS